MPWLAVLILASLITAITAPAGAQGIDPALALGTWNVVEIEGTPAAFAETMRFSDSKVEGKGACNSFSAGAKQSGQLLEIGLMASTHMHCEGKMDAEMRYFTALQAARRYTLDKDTLSLLAADSHVLLKLTRQP